MRSSLIIILSLMLCCSLPARAQQGDDQEQLGMAIEYFTSGKYHEALLIFQRLDKQYKLNDRFRAYIGLCHYYEWEYKEAAKYLDEVLPRLEALAPKERSVYYYTDAESHFLLEQYDEAIPLYEHVLLLGYDRDKGDVFYRLGFCYMFKEKWQEAADNFTAARDYYLKFRNTDDLSARMAQIERMIQGCKANIDEDKDEDENENVNDKENVSPSYSYPQNTEASDPLPNQ